MLKKFDIEGSDEMRFIAALIEDSASKAIARIVWFGDKAVSRWCCNRRTKSRWRC